MPTCGLPLGEDRNESDPASGLCGKVKASRPLGDMSITSTPVILPERFARTTQA